MVWPLNGLIIIDRSNSMSQHVIQPDELFKYSTVSAYLLDDLCLQIF